MRLTHHLSEKGYVWAADGRALGPEFRLSALLSLPASELSQSLHRLGPVSGRIVAPCDEAHEVWASGVTYLRSRQEREAESTVADVYARVYDADRPELFFKSNGWRVVGHEDAIRIRRDSTWDVPEPELTLVINRFGEIVGYTAGNDVSSRSIEGENPLYLPQAKTYDGSCALGPAIILGEPDVVPIRLEVHRAGTSIFQGETSTAAMRRSFRELVDHLFRETSFPHGVFLMTGTGIVPPHPFTLQPDDVVQVDVGELTLRNVVTREL